MSPSGSTQIRTSLPSPCFHNQSTTKFRQESFSFDLFILLILLSLFFQILLIILAPCRKHSRSFLLGILSVVYVLELGNVSYAIGMIHINTVEGGSQTGELLQVFWTPFLVVHFCGLNTLTGISQQDNELWLRYATHFISACYTFVRVFFHESFLKSQLWVPTAIMFLVGAVKYIEKVVCHFSARITKFRESTVPKPSPGLNYARLMQTYDSFKKSYIPVEFEISSAASDQVRLAPSRSSSPAPHSKLTQVQIVKAGHRSFRDFRGLFARTVFTYHERNKTRQYFLSIPAEEAFSICEVVLNLAYDVFYTKAILIHKTKWAPLLSIFTFILELVSLVLWINVNRHCYPTSSVYVTHVLVFGSTALEFLSLCMLFTSDWLINEISLNKFGFYEKLLEIKESSRKSLRKKRRSCNVVLQSFCLRWSESIPQCNFIDDFLDKYLESGRGRYFHGARKWSALPSVQFPDKLKNFIFNELQTRSFWAEHPKDVEELCAAKGMWILNRLSREWEHKDPNIEVTFAPWIRDVDYEESLIIWHIATTLCYNDHDSVLQFPNDDQNNDLRQFSKIISDYMLHLITGRGSWAIPMSTEVIGKMIGMDTHAECKRFFDRILPQLPPHSLKDMKKRLQVACKMLMQVNTQIILPNQIRGESQSKSMLFEACILAKQLHQLREKGINMWELISKVWAEMLFYSASQSSPDFHVHRVRRGGELLSLVWILMSLLGLGKQFRYKNGKVRKAQMVIGKHS